MNYLAHLYLSGDDPLVITGNFMADGVKGRDLSRYDPRIQEGIRLHRAIDVFTDAHRLTRAGRERLRPHAHKYAGVVLDLFYDHLLAAQWESYHDEPLGTFAHRMYALLGRNMAHMPERIRRMLPYMSGGDWLGGYARLGGLAGALRGLSRRVRAGEVMAGAERVLVEHEDIYRSEFASFFAELRHHLAER